MIFERINTSKFDEREKVLEHALINKHILPKQGISYDEANLKLRVINLSTWEEYQSVAYVASYYIPKLQEWALQKEFEITEIPNGEIELLMNGFFIFYLTLISQSDIDVMKNEIVKLRKETKELQKSYKLFRDFFFKHWNEGIRKAINKDDELKHKLWESTDSLYNTATASGFLFQEYGSLTNNLFIFSDSSQNNVEYGDEQHIPQVSDQNVSINWIIEMSNKIKDEIDADYINEDTNVYKPPKKKANFTAFIDGENINWEASRMSVVKKNINEFGEAKSLVVKVDKHINPGRKYKVLIPKSF